MDFMNFMDFMDSRDFFLYILVYRTNGREINYDHHLEIKSVSGGGERCIKNAYLRYYSGRYGFLIAKNY